MGEGFDEQKHVLLKGVVLERLTLLLGSGQHYIPEGLASCQSVWHRLHPGAKLCQGLFVCHLAVLSTLH